MPYREYALQYATAVMKGYREFGRYASMDDAKENAENLYKIPGIASCRVVREMAVYELIMEKR